MTRVNQRIANQSIVYTIISVIMVPAVFLCGGLGSVFSNPGRAAEVGYESEFLLSERSESHQPQAIGAGDTVSGYFESSLPIHSIGVLCPSYGNNKGSLTFSLYVWHDNIEKTLSGEPLVTKRFVDFEDNAILRLEIQERPVGKWLWVLNQGEEQVGIWKGKSGGDTRFGSRSFYNGEEIDGSWEVAVGCITDFPFSGTIAEYEEEVRAQKKSIKVSVDSVPDEQDVMADTWTGRDGLGRELPVGLDILGGQDTSGTKGELRDVQVGIFYWTWHERMARGVERPWDVTKIITEHPEAVNDPEHPAWGPWGAPHHWGEPLFGYYSTLDRWVLRKHAQLLAAAGVDVVIFDCTNATWTWMDSTMALLETFDQAKKDGVRTPKIAFMLPFGNQEWTRTDLIQLWRDLYRDGRYQDHWFYWQGRPLIYAIPESLNDTSGNLTKEEQEERTTIRQFFSFRPGQAAYTGGPRRSDNWSWLEVWPQYGYGRRTDGRCDMVSVGVAQNFSSNNREGRRGLSAMNDRNVFGRAYVEGAERDERPDAYLYGGNFQQQWERAKELNPAFVFVTGWNEWIAGRAPEWQGMPNAFPDEYNDEFSRDIEPSRGILQDHYYMQLVANIRKYKGVRPQPSAGEPVTINLNRADDAQDPWLQVTPVFRDWKGDVMARDAQGYGDTHYRDTSGRNDIITAQISRDDENIYFCVETNAPLTPVSDPNRMRLYLCVEGRDTASWETFQYLIGRSAADGTVSVEESTGGWNWEERGRATCRERGNRLELAIPRALLGLVGESAFSLRFKWADNSVENGDIMEFYTLGDAAPDGRFTWNYRVE